MTSRADRLLARIDDDRHRVVWLRAAPGTGKSRLLAMLAGREGADAVRIVDDAEDAVQPVTALVSAALAVGRAPGPRLILASRPSVTLDMALARPRLYGQIVILGDADLFFTPEESAGLAGGGAVHALTGGWPCLIDSAMSGRAEDTRALLPDYLDRHGLPNLPQDVVTALFAAAEEPLRKEAVDRLFGAGAALHPLLQQSGGDVRVSGLWVEEALRSVRGRPGLWRRSTADGLARLYILNGDPARAIVSLNGMGQQERAIEVLEQAGGAVFGFRFGFDRLQRALDSFPAGLEDRIDSLLFARITVLVKSGRTQTALMRLDARYPGLPVDLRRMRYSHRPYAILFRLLVEANLAAALPPDRIESWGLLEALLDSGDDLACGRLHNAMALAFIRAGEPLRARRSALKALSAYERARSPYLQHYIHIHLADLLLREGRLRNAALHLGEARRALAASGLAYNSEEDVLALFEARLGHERGDPAALAGIVDRSLAALVAGDSWPELFLLLAQHGVAATLWRDGVAAAETRLDRCAADLQRRHGATDERAMALLRVRLLQLGRRHAEAAELLEELEDGGAPAASVGEDLIRLRARVLQARDRPSVLDAVRQQLDRPGLAPRRRITLGLFAAHLRLALGERGLARRHFAAVLRLAAAEGLVAPLLEDGEVLERLLRAVPPDPARTDARVRAMVDRLRSLLRTQPATETAAAAAAGLTRQELRILLHLSEGETSKEAARRLGLSESAVKFHLRNLFRKFDVARRSDLIERARREAVLA